MKYLLLNKFFGGHFVPQKYIKVFLFLSFISVNLLASNINFSGLIFSNYNFYTSRYISNGNLANNFNTFDVGRIYLTASSNFSENFSSSFTLEANTLSNGNNVFLKLAYLSYISSNKKFYYDFGLIPSLWISWEEGAWNNVFIDFVQMHYLKLINPSDKGIRGGYKLYDKLKFEIMLSNGEGFKIVETSKTKNIDTKLTYTYNDFGIAIFYINQLGVREKELLASGVYYNMNSLKIGYSVFKVIEYSTNSIHREGFSIYSNYNINKKNVVFVRYDYFNRNISKPNNISNYWVFGFKNKPMDNIEIALTYRLFIPKTEMITFKREEYISSNVYVKF